VQRFHYDGGKLSRGICEKLGVASVVHFPLKSFYRLNNTFRRGYAILTALELLLINSLLEREYQRIGPAFACK
jgi:hypothetical protein